MKTTLQQLDRMEALVRKLAAQYESANNKPIKGTFTSPDSLAYTDCATFLEARAIVAELPEPVDPDTITARELCSELCKGACATSEYSKYVYEGYSSGKWDATLPMVKAVAALRRAREEGVR